MAKVEVKRTPRTVETVVYDDLINLAMTKDEAEALQWVLEKVGGDPLCTPRKHIEEIYNALYLAKVKTLDWPAQEKCSSLYFAKKNGL